MLEEHLEKLRAFHMTAAEGSFLQASRKLGLTQPAVTKSVRLLEQHLNVSLFVRHARGVGLTEHGRLLKDFCENLFLRIRDLERKFISTHEIAGVVKIGTYETLGEMFWPKVLLEIGKRHEGLVVELTTEEPENHWRKLETGALDIVVDAEPRVQDAFHSRVLYKDSFGLFCKKKSRFLSQESAIPISYVKRARDRVGATIEQHLKRHAVKFDLRYTVESFTMVRSLVAEGVCVGVLPLRLAAKMVKQGLVESFGLRGLHDRFGEHRICATTLYDLKDETRIASLIAILEDVSKN